MLRKTGLRKVFAIAFTSVSLAGCAAYGSTTAEPYPYPYPGGIVEIPRGHMPPPGECQIWYPNLLPGQQPPPGDCYELEHQVPPGAVLVRG